MTITPHEAYRETVRTNIDVIESHLNKELGKMKEEFEMGEDGKISAKAEDAELNREVLEDIKQEEEVFLRA